MIVEANHKEMIGEGIKEIVEEEVILHNIKEEVIIPQVEGEIIEEDKTEPSEIKTKDVLNEKS